MSVPRNCFSSNLMPSYEPDRAPDWNAKYVLPLLLTGSLWHKGAYNRIFPCMETYYPYAIKNQRGASLVGGILCSKAPSRELCMADLVLYGIRLLAEATH